MPTNGDILMMHQNISPRLYKIDPLISVHKVRTETHRMKFRNQVSTHTLGYIHRIEHLAAIPGR